MDYEIRGCKEDFIVGYGYHVEEVPDEDADFFGIYKKDEKNSYMWVSDHDTRKEAEKAMKKLKEKKTTLKFWKISYSCSPDNLPISIAYPTRADARLGKKVIQKFAKGKVQIYKTSVQDMGGGIFIEVSEKVR